MGLLEGDGVAWSACEDRGKGKPEAAEQWYQTKDKIQAAPLFFNLDISHTHNIYYVIVFGLHTPTEQRKNVAALVC